MQVYLNDHEWLARKLTAQGVRYTKHDNAFVWIEDMARAQRFADRFVNLKWPAILNGYAKQVVPQLHDILSGCEHYWVSAQSEYSTDILFKTRRDLSELYPKLLSHSTLCFGAKEVMNFLGRAERVGSSLVYCLSAGQSPSNSFCLTIRLTRESDSPTASAIAVRL